MRIVTNRRVYSVPTSLELALDFVDGLRESPACRWVEPGPRWWATFSQLGLASAAKGNLVPDAALAALAALAIESGCELLTADRGFGRYPGLRWRHPVDA